MPAARSTRPGGGSILVFSGDLNFAGIKQLHADLLRHFHAGTRVVLDLTAIGSLDLAGLQVLYAALASARALNSQFDIKAGVQAERLDRLCDFCGLPRLPFAAPDATGGANDL